MEFRIIEIVKHLEYDNVQGLYIIEKKGWFGWREVKHVEVSSKRLSYPSYDDAEKYMISNYMGSGNYRRNGNVYDYIPYMGYSG